MRNRILPALLSFALIAVLFPVRAHAEDVTPSELPPAEAAEITASPSLVFDELEHDFGEIKQQSNVKHVFTFRNDGNGLLVVDNVKASCGCTGTLLSNKEIPPGESGEIEVSFRSGLKRGKQKKSISVYSNDPQNPTIKLYIMANIITPVEFIPAHLNWTINRNELSKKAVQLFHQPELDIEITKMETSSPAFKAVATPRENGERPGYDIEITCDGSIPTSQFVEKLVVTTNNPEHPTLHLIIRGSINSNIKVIPNRIALGVVKGDNLPSRSIRVFAKDKETNFEIINIEASSPLISTEITEDEKAKEYLVNISLTAKPPVGGFAEKVFIRTSLEDEYPSEVNVYAFVTEID
jgi:hypothetical protein